MTEKSAQHSRAMTGEEWFTARGWAPFDFQREVWSACERRENGLIHAPTGTGKTYAIWLGILQQEMQEEKWEGLRVLWITPLRALAGDTSRSLLDPVEEMGLPIEVQTRTGDTPSKIRARQRKRLPHTLITTPESLSLMLSYQDTRKRFQSLQWVVVDEWHELMGSKRGVQTELAMARLRRWNPQTAIWGLSATLGNLNTARDALFGIGSPREGKLYRALLPKQFEIESVLPESVDRFPWSGHQGLHLVPLVVEKLAGGKSTLVFTNTRSQTEAWYQAILEARPEYAGTIALHHGSVDRGERQWVEEALKAGRLRCVVCTSSLDLGVDFSPVDQVIQVGSSKGVARLLQRAGRSGHQPGQTSRITCVPTHAFEVIEAVAVREAATANEIEERKPLEKPLDVLAQHLVTVAAGEGFNSEELYVEVCSACAFRNLSRREWAWTLDFVAKGGKALRAYADLHRIEREGDRFVSTNRRLLQRHRMTIGTITSDGALPVRFRNGRRLGQVEESFLSRLSGGDRFTFAGRILEFIHIKDSVAWVKRASGKRGLVPRWMGGRMPLSSELAAAVRRKLTEAAEGVFEGVEMEWIRPILEVQAELSLIPRSNQLLIEKLKTREGHHLFIYPFGGRLVHEGLAALFAQRLAQQRPLTFSFSANDYGFELLSPMEAPLAKSSRRDLTTRESLLEDIKASLNATQMAKQQFREIARVAGLVFEGYPGRRKTSRQVQLSSGLLYDVFQNYDPKNLLLYQAEREVLENQLEYSRLRREMDMLENADWRIVEVERPTPFGLPLLVDRLRNQLSSEKLRDRVRRMVVDFESL